MRRRPNARDLAEARQLAHDRELAGPLRRTFPGESSKESWVPWNHPLTAPISFSLLTLTDGRVLRIGGGLDPGKTQKPLEHAAELLDPATGIWSLILPLPTHTGAALAVALPSNRILLAGGFDHRKGVGPHGTWFSAPYHPPEMDPSMLKEAWTWDPLHGGRSTGPSSFSRGHALAP